MYQQEQSDPICPRCKESVDQFAKACPNCGILLMDGIMCYEHPSVPAKGVCPICNRVCCAECGGENARVFLCNHHWTYEVQEGLARVYGSTDYVQAQLVTTCLEQAGFHPFFYSRRANPGADVSTIASHRNFGNYPITEMKVLVPFSEVLSAENELHTLGFTEVDEDRTA